MSLRGSTKEFPLESVIGLLAGTSKTGELQVRAGGKVGALGFAGGRLVAAVMESEGGESALGAIFAVSEADFEFTPWASPPEANLEAGDLVAVLKRAAEARDRLAGIREQIPDDHLRFKLSEKAADQGAVTFTPDRWRALLAVNGERDVAAIAEQLRLGKMQALTLLAGLVKDGVIETISPPDGSEFGRAAPRYAPEPERVAPEPFATQEEAAIEGEPEPKAAREPEWSREATREPSPAAEAPHEWAPQAAAPEPATPSPEEWSPHPWSPAPAPADETRAPQTEVRADLNAEISERLGGFGSPPETPAASSTQVPPAVDDRLSALTSLFAPGPAANAPPPAQPKTEEAPATSGDPWGSPPPAPAPSAPAPKSPTRSADSWMPPPPAASETPANVWTPTATPKEPPPPADPWAPRSSTSAPQAAAPPAPAAQGPAVRRNEWEAMPQAAGPAAPAAAPAEKKRGGLFGMFRREEAPAAPPVSRIEPVAVGTKAGLLASLSNALLMEYNSGAYGKGKIETRLANLLMRVDEQADPIDRPLPVVDDLIDAAALEREGLAEEQAVPYLATLVRQIYEDAEHAFGKDKAKKGYKAAQQQVFGGEAAALQSPDLAGKLPKV